jgi:hypothetical protein
MVGLTPGLDSIMVLLLAWLLAPIDFVLTWIGWYKKVKHSNNKDKIF